ncbi:unnamed protein product [Gemmataceae bacterium]|nr:unnamed protein product [Gemmataceae bacterium]VTT97581.1 unnamed protein product [Gemmataceae bacterium]
MAEGEAGVSGGALVFRGRLTEADAVALRRCHDRVIIRRPFRWLAGLAAAGMIVMMSWYIASHGPDTVSVLFLVGCAYVLFGFRAERTWATRRHYRRHPDEYLETEARLTPGLVAITNAAHRTEFAWRLVGGLADDPAGVLFYTRDRQPVLWLPSRLFEGNDLRERVLALAAKNGVEVSCP